MATAIKKSLVLLSVIILILVVTITLRKKASDNNKNEVDDIWEELGIYPYDSSIPVVYGKEYFIEGKYQTVLDKRKLPDGPFCLIVPIDVMGAMNIANVKNVVDIIWLPSMTGFIEECPNLKRVVYACRGDLEASNWYKDEMVATICGFQSCDSIETVEFLRDDIVYEIDYMNGLKWFEIPKNTIIIGNSCNGWNMEEYVCQSSFKTIDGCFSKCDKLKYLELNEGLEKLRSSFFGDTSLEYVVMPKSLTEISEGNFLYCNPDMTLVVYKDSASEEYAKKNNIRYIYREAFDFEKHKEK